MPQSPENRPGAVVAVRFSALGDVALTIPVLYDLCRAYPERKVVFVTRKRFAQMAVDAPANLVVEGIDLDLYKGVGGMWRLAAHLCREYDVAAFVDLHDVLRTRMLRCFMRMRGVPVTVIEKGRRDKKSLVALGAAAYKANGGGRLPSTMSRYRDALARAGFDVPEVFESLYPPVAAGETDGIFRVGIAPFAAHESKTLPAETMEKIIDRLAGEDGVEIYLFGAGNDEAERIDGWIKNRSNVVNMARRREGLAEELRLMSRLDVMLAMDSGNMHLASVARTPRVVSVWCATHPDAGFVPFGACEADMIGADLPCRPCTVYGKTECRRGDWLCRKALSADTIADRILKYRP